MQKAIRGMVVIRGIRRFFCGNELGISHCYYAGITSEEVLGDIDEA